VIEQSAKLLANTSAKLTGVTGGSTMLMAYFQSNAAGIGALCTVITLIFYIFFQFLAHKKTNQVDKNLELIKILEEKLNNKLDKG